MKKYLFWRVMQIIPVLLLISMFVFGLLYMAGDPVALMLPEDATQEQVDSLRASLGLDQPFYVQYFHFVGDLLRGDFGYSYRYNQPALPIVLERLPATFELAFSAMFVAIIMAIPLGIASATKRNTFLDIFISGGSVLGKAMPNFWLGIMLILMFAITYPFFPVSGSGSFAHLILPAITLGTASAAEMTRVLRSSMLETLNQDYVRTAVSKGVRNTKVVNLHAFRNALVPFITITFLQTSSLVSGALITEVVFSWPGLGQLLIQAINGRDMAIVQASIFMVAFIVIAMNLFADILYRVLDPRIRYD
ncbi:LOW QUALITY PROTEIN: dipeptide transport system permease protein DppB [Geomicrobium sp. JCM 19037]|uniref:ABC transporter permease n=1 Tax=Geomicrobium sp. JCM 19039 TaxID=1460636 RepID=UPI00045F4896|nr:ABC transporter permease [Geomicrobium sp. JCM 19039]GAK05082.1 LOW QUALITY PROTEIN: dipeptide transport system permease protein DppB [Geomicrobium sp. JCM 19037]GAK13093.1 dipeptide transport system permease protein DppB [Geomicrobium sp. JCM 19039]